MKHLAKIALVFIAAVFLSGCTQLFDKGNRAGLQVITNDVAASVFLDGQFLEKTPFIGKDFKPASYTLRIEPEDATLVPYETTVTLRRGLLTVVTWKPGSSPETSGGVIYELEKLENRRKSELSVVSIPDGAVISIDQGSKEFAPYLTEELAVGTHQLTVTLPSYETQEHTINIVEGHRLNVLLKLAKSGVNLPAANKEPSQPNEATAAAEVVTQTASPSATTVNSNSNTGSTVTITSTNFFQDGVEVLRVRDAAGSGGAELGFIEVGSEVPYLDETESGWYKIEFEGEEGWVSSQFAELSE